MSDNFVFSHEIRPGYAKFYSGADIAVSPLSVEGTFRQAWEMYFSWCGRYAGNLVVYLLFMLPRPLYVLIATAGFAFYIILLHICIFGRVWRQNLSGSWIFALATILWVGMPSFGEAFFWLSVGGEAALIAQAVVFIPFRFAIDDVLDSQKHPGPLVCALFFCGCVFSALLDYPTSAALPVTAIACTGWLLYKNRYKIPILPVCGAAGLCLGGFLTLCAPGNAQRIVLSRDPAVHAYAAATWTERVLSWFGSLPEAILWQFVPLFFLCWSCLVLWRHYGRSWLRHIPPAAFLFLLPALLTHGAYLFTAWPPPRAFATSYAQFCVCACIVYVCAKNFLSAVFCHQFKMLRLSLGIFCILSLCVEAPKFFFMHQAAMVRETEILAAKEHAEVSPLPKGNGDRYWVLGKYQPDISTDPSFWVNRAFAAHYGLKSIKVNDGQQWGSYAVSPGIGESALKGVSVVLEDGKIVVKADDCTNFEKASPVHLYFYDANSLLNLLPKVAGDRIYSLLAHANRGSFLSCLVPILLTRTDISLSPSPLGGMHGESTHKNVFGDDRLWLVRPGDGKLSFDLIPLDKQKMQASLPRCSVPGREFLTLRQWQTMTFALRMIVCEKRHSLFVHSYWNGHKYNISRGWKIHA